LVFANLIEKATHVTLFWNLSRNLDKISSKFAEKMHNSTKKIKKSEIQFVNREKMNFRFLAEILSLKNGAKECKCNCVDLGEIFPTSIYLQNLASIQPRTSPSKFGRKIQFNIQSCP